MSSSLPNGGPTIAAERSIPVFAPAVFFFVVLCGLLACNSASLYLLWWGDLGWDGVITSARPKIMEAKYVDDDAVEFWRKKPVWFRFRNFVRIFCESHTKGGAGTELLSPRLFGGVSRCAGRESRDCFVCMMSRSSRGFN